MANRDDLAQLIDPVYGRTEQEAVIQEYLKNGGQNLDPKTTAWCASFVNATLQQAGLPGSGSQAARSFETYGEPVLSPQPGDIGVFARGDDPSTPQNEAADKSLGHAGFYTGDNDEFGRFNILGGNTSDAVGVAPIETDRLLSFRRPPGLEQPPEQQAFSQGLSPQLNATIDNTQPFRKPGASPDERMAGGIPSAVEAAGGTMTPALSSAMRPRPEPKLNLQALMQRMSGRI